jgi:hypothetical protein
MLMYLLANPPRRSMPVIAVAIVGGAVSAGTACWSEGVVAPLAGHILWTGATLAISPKVAATEGDG